MDNRHEDMVQELGRILNTIDGRDFIYQFILESCGVDYTLGVPSGIKDEFNSGLKKPAIDLFNLMFYNHQEKFNLMLKEQLMRLKQKEKNYD